MSNIFKCRKCRKRLIWKEFWLVPCGLCEKCDDIEALKWIKRRMGKIRRGEGKPLEIC